MTRDGWRQACLVAAMILACGCSPKISDTGYTGTWTKHNTIHFSTIAIVKQGDDYRFRWRLTSTEGRWEVRCGWDGPCEEYRDGEKVALHTFRAWIDEGTQRLRVECRGENLVEGGKPIHYIDELVVKDGGTRLMARTLEQSGVKYEKQNQPRRFYEKVSDEVEDPPKPTSGGGG